MTDSTKHVALITGASSGIGSAYAWHLAKQGHDLLLVARRLDHLDTLADEIRADCSVDVRILQADLSSEEGCTSVEACFASGPPIDVLVNNAGVGALGAFIDCDPLATTKLIALNITALTRLSYAALQHFRIHRSGTLINIGSIGALRVMKNGATYGASKAYVLNFSRSLQLEVEELPIRVQVVMPGPVRTEFFSAAGADESIFPTESFISPETLVAAAMKGLELGELVTFPTLADVSKWDEVARLQADLRESAGRLGLPAERYDV
jgi:short-subunit dehydrogenase